MAADAADRLRALVEAGEEIPYEVHESGDGSPLCRYEPLTERFVHAHAAELRALDSFGTAAAALESSGLAAHYLERMGIAVPDDPGRRSDLAGVAFLCRLWMNSSDFSLEQARLDAAIDEIEAGSDVATGEIEVIVPVRGLQLPLARLDLEWVSVVRADTVEVPTEAQSGDLSGASPWEPPFLAVVRVPDPTFSEEEEDAGAIAVETFRRLITTLRLFKAGGVGLGPHAWTKVSGDRWRRIGTGAGRPRPGGYRLTETELGPLVALSRTLASPSSPFGRARVDGTGMSGALNRAVSRFEAGLERNVVVEALNDHLLCLRFVLEGGGPASLGLSIRVAALCAEPDRREDVKAVIDRAAALERELWSGEPAPRSAGTMPAETAIELEELARAILKDACCGHLGSNLRATADEILLADGLAAGDGDTDQRGETAEWSPRIQEELEQTFPQEDGLEPEEGPVAEEPEREPIPLGLDAEEPELIDELDRLDRTLEDSRPVERTIWMTEEPEEMPVSATEDNIRAEIAALEQLPATSSASRPGSPPPPDDRSADEVPADGTSPVLRLIEQTRAERLERNERVADLFPPPETTEWNIREVAYDRRRRAVIRDGDPEAQQAS